MRQYGQQQFVHVLPIELTRLAVMHIFQDATNAIVTILNWFAKLLGRVVGKEMCEVPIQVGHFMQLIAKFLLHNNIFYMPPVFSGLRFV